jgi:predicted Zn-dependent protease
MSTPINLNKARKAKTRAENKAQADSNSVAFGRTKAQRLLEVTQSDQASKRLDALKFDDD